MKGAVFQKGLKMKPQPDIHDMRKFLLHDLNDEAQNEIEEHIHADPAFREQLEMAQNDLVDDFANGFLSEEERAKFETDFLTTPERVSKVRFARAMAHYVIAHPPSTGAEGREPLGSLWSFLRAHRFKLAFAVLLIVAVLVALSPVMFTWRHAISPLDSRRSALEQELAVLNTSGAKQTSSGVFSRTLKPTVVRDVGDSRRLELPADGSVVSLRLELLTAERRSFRATLETNEGDEIATVQSLPAQESGGSRFVTLKLPSKLLPPGDYQVRLLGVGDERPPAEVGLYPFQIVSSR